MHLPYTDVLSLRACPKSLVFFFQGLSHHRTSRVCFLTTFLINLLILPAPTQVCRSQRLGQRAAFPGAYVVGAGTGNLCETIWM